MLLIVGRTSSGKDYLASKLEELGYTSVLSRTTRPKRNENDKHLFVSQEQADKEKNRVAETIINGYEYYTLEEDIINKDIYVIDPLGLKSLSKANLNLEYTLAYVFSDYQQRLGHYVSRGGDIAKFNSRNQDETKQFDDFERVLKNNNAYSKKDICKEYINCGDIIMLHNDYTDKWTKESVSYIDTLLARVKQKTDLQIKYKG